MKTFKTIVGGSCTGSARMRRRMVARVLAAVGLLVSGMPSYGLNVTWNLATGGNWDQVTANWSGDAAVYTNGDAATFNNNAGGTIALIGTIAPLSTTVSAASGAYTFTGTGITSGSLSKSGGGTLILNNANTYAGGTTIAAGSGQVTATVNTAQNAIGAGAASIGANSTLQLNNTNTSGTTVNIGNTFTGTGLLKLNFAAGGSARNTTMAGVTGFDGVIQLTNSGANGDKWNVIGINAPDAIVQIDSGSQLLPNGTASTFESVRIIGTGNTENRGAIRLVSTTLNAPISLLGNATIGSEGTGGFINGTISTAVAGTSTLTLGTANSPILPADMIKDVISDGIGTLALNVFNQNSGNIFILGNKLNTYSGGTTLLNSSSGTRLVINTITGTPYGSGAITVGQAATDRAGIYFTGANQTLANDIVMNTALGNDRPGLRSDVANVTLSGQITANLADALFSTNGNASFNLTGKVTGAMGLNLDNQFGATLSVTLNNAAENNDYAGNTNIEATKTTLILGRNNQIPNGLGKGNVILDGRLNLNGFSDTINGLSGNGILDGVSGTPTFTVGDNNATSTFGGVITDTAGALTLNKIGSGVLSLAGVNTYAGHTNINAGTLALTGAGSINGSPVISIDTGATFDVSSVSGGYHLVSGQSLIGDGSIIGDVVTDAGSLISPGFSPGFSIGTLGFSAGLDIDGGVLIEVDPTAAGQKIDIINVAGLLDLSDAALEFDFLTTPIKGVFIFANYGSLNGEFSSVTGLPAGFWVDYRFNGQNQIALINVPEPATMSLLALGGLGLLRRRRVTG